MKDFKILKVLDGCKGLFEKFNIDYPVMRKILQVKLVMDSRKVPTIINNSRKKKNTEDRDSNQFLKSLWIYVVMGAFLAFLVGFGNHYMFQMSLFFGVLMFMMMSALVADFSSVLLDTRDKTIILAKPVSSRTAGMAKLMHIGIYMFYITIAFSGISLAVGLVKHGFAFFILFLALIVLADIFLIILTALLYLLILRFFDGEKLKDIINYFQIGLTIAMSVGYQLLIRLFDVTGQSIHFGPEWWQFFIIPTWFGAPFELFLHNNTAPVYIALSAMAFIIPIVSIMTYIKLMPVFERSLQKLTSVSRSKKTSKTISSLAAKLLCRGREERIFFQFANDMMKNERDFKLKVYPAVGIALVFPFIFLFNQIGTEGLEAMRKSDKFLTMYFCGLMIPSLVMMLQYSAKYKAAWIFKSIPLTDERAIYSGTLKAAFIRFVIPVFVLLCVAYTIIFGIRIVPDLFVVLLTLFLYTIISFKFLDTSLPFSKSYDAIQQSEGIKLTVLLVLLLLFAGIHFLCNLISPMANYVYLLVLLLSNLISWKKAI
jgi:ABC-2 type transport system permease protein